MPLSQAVSGNCAGGDGSAGEWVENPKALRMTAARWTGSVATLAGIGSEAECVGGCFRQE